MRGFKSGAQAVGEKTEAKDAISRHNLQSLIAVYCSFPGKLPWRLQLINFTIVQLIVAVATSEHNYYLTKQI
jgi:hypothetical protein